MPRSRGRAGLRWRAAAKPPTERREPCGDQARRRAQAAVFLLDGRPDAAIDQIRRVRRAGRLDRREERDVDAPGLGDRSEPELRGAEDGRGDDRSAGLDRQASGAVMRRAERLGLVDSRALGEEDQEARPARARLSRDERLGLAAADGRRPEAREEPAERAAEELDLGHEAHASPRRESQEERVEEALVVGGDDPEALGGNMFGAAAPHAEPGAQNERGEQPHDRVQRRRDAAVAREAVRSLRRGPHRQPFPTGSPRLTSRPTSASSACSVPRGNTISGQRACRDSACDTLPRRTVLTGP